MSNNYYTHKATLETVSVGGFFEPIKEEVQIEKVAGGYKYHCKEDISEEYGDYNDKGQRVDFHKEPVIVLGRRFTLFNIEPLREKIEIKQCALCHTDCTGEDYEHFDEDGDRICEDCYMEDNFSRCSVCEESIPNDEIDEKHFIYENGLYEILSKPYYSTDGFSMSLFEDSVRKIKKLNEEHEDTSTMCADCLNCFKKEK